MIEEIDKYAEFKASYKRLNTDIACVIDRAVGNGVPDILIADQLLYVSMTMMVTFLELGETQLTVECWASITPSYFHNRRREFGVTPATKPSLHKTGGDRVGVFTEIAAVEIATQQLRDDLLALGRNGIGNFFAGELCGPFLDQAHNIANRSSSLREDGWEKIVTTFLQRFTQGELRNDHELLEVVANRSLSAGTRTVSERHLQS